MGYHAGAWLAFGAALAGVAGALTGLLFVAVSIKNDVLARSRNLSSYWLLPAAVTSLLGGVTSAWLFLVQVTG